MSARYDTVSIVLRDENSVAGVCMHFRCLDSFTPGTDLRNTIINQNALDVLPQMEAETFNMVFADPPYNLQLQNDLYRPNLTKVDAVDDKWDQFANFASYDEFTTRWLTECRRVMKPNATLWVIGTYHNIFRVGRILQDLGFWILNDVVWVKSNPMPNFRGVRFTNATETLIWAVKDKSVKDYTFNYELMKQFNDGKQMRSDWYLNEYPDAAPGNDWRFPLCRGKERLQHEGQKVHSTQKPLALVERTILASTNEGDLVLDPFAGTGTTAHAATVNNRDFCMVEVEKNYVDWIVKRLEGLEATPDTARGGDR